MTAITQQAIGRYMHLPFMQKIINRVKDTLVCHESLIERLRKEIEVCRDTCGYTTTRNKITAVNTLERFIDSRPSGAHRLTSTNVSPDDIKAFELWALTRNRPSTVALHMRCLKALMNRINNRGTELFRAVRTSNSQANKRGVDADTIGRIHQLPLTEGSTTATARDLFMFCFYCMGMPPIDAVFLKKEQYKDGNIIYYRHKTHRQVQIKVCREAEQIIKKYADADSPFLLPFMKQGNEGDLMRQYRCFYQRYRRGLVNLASRFGNMRLTSYMARHSWASIAYRNCVSLNVIAQALGHANTNVTLYYIRKLDNSMVDQANDMVLKSIRCIKEESTDTAMC